MLLIGRYLLTQKSLKRKIKAPGAGNEVQLTDADDTLNKTQRVFARNSG